MPSPNKLILTRVITVGTAALQCSKALYELLDNIREAPDQIIAISRDAHAFYSVVCSLDSALLDEVINSVLEKDGNLATLVGNLEQPIRNCSKTLGQMMVKIQAHVKTSDKNDLKFSLDLKWYFTKRGVKEGMDRLGHDKATLDTALSALTAVITLRLMANDRYQANSPKLPERTSTDVGEALKQYAESVLIEDSIDNSKFGCTRSLSKTSVPESDATALMRKVSDQRVTLHQAAEDGDEELVQRLLESGVNIDTTASDGRTALHFAAECGNDAIVSTLLERGAYVSAASIPSGGWHDKKFYGGRTPLHWAAAGSHQHIIELLLDNGADPGATNVTGRTPLQECIMNGRTAVAWRCSKLLIANGAPVRCADDSGYTPLHEAANCGRVRIAELLLDSGADLEAVNAAPADPSWERHSECTPLMLATRLGSFLTVKLLLDRRANVKATNSLGEMAIHEAASYGNVDIVRLLLDAGCSTEERNPARLDETPIHKAAGTGMAAVVHTLLTRGADKLTANSQGHDACEIARRAGHDEVVSILSDVRSESA